MVPRRAALEAQRELRVLGHLVRGPRRRERHVGADLLDAVELAHELLDLLRDLGADRAAGRGERERHVDGGAVDLDVVDQAELDEVQAELGIDDLGQGVGDLFDGCHGPQSSPARPTLRGAMFVLGLVLVFIVLPIAELYVLIQVGDWIGVWWTLLILIADSILGSLLLRSQGRAAWRRFNVALAEGRAPAREVLDGGLIIFGGAFLITPGFLTDIIGLLLILPPTRAVF